MEQILRFSVIIPLYDKASSIARAIESVLSQSCPAHEIIVIDDASTDGGADIAARYANRGVQLLRRSEPGPGGYAARNLGIAHSSGPWVAFLDADDLWRPDHLEALVQAQAAVPDAVMLMTRYDHIFANGREQDHVVAQLRSGVKKLDFASFLSAWLEAGHCPAWTGAIAVRRAIFDNELAFPAGQALRGGDKQLWLRLARLGPVAFNSRSTSEFYREANNKVTVRTDTTGLPILIPAARAMIPDATAPEQRLLRRLINQEIGLYARWAAQSGLRPKTKISDFAHPIAVKSIATWIAARYGPSGAFKIIYAYKRRFALNRLRD